MLATDVPGDMATAGSLELPNEASPPGNDQGLMACGHQRMGDLQRSLFDAAAFQGGQNLDDLHASSLTVLWAHWIP